MHAADQPYLASMPTHVDAGLSESIQRVIPEEASAGVGRAWRRESANHPKPPRHKLRRWTMIMVHVSLLALLSEVPKRRRVQHANLLQGAELQDCCCFALIPSRQHH